MKIIFDAILLLCPKRRSVWFRPQIRHTIWTSAKFQWNEVVKFIISQIASATIRRYDLGFEPIGNPLLWAHSLCIPRDTNG